MIEADAISSESPFPRGNRFFK